LYFKIIEFNHSTHLSVSTIKGASPIYDDSNKNFPGLLFPEFAPYNLISL
jgi:hypothetical protein